MHTFWKYITDRSLKNAVRWYFCQAHFMLFVSKPKEILQIITKEI